MLEQNMTLTRCQGTLVKFPLEFLIESDKHLGISNKFTFRCTAVICRNPHEVPGVRTGNKLFLVMIVSICDRTTVTFARHKILPKRNIWSTFISTCVSYDPSPSKLRMHKCIVFSTWPFLCWCHVKTSKQNCSSKGSRFPKVSVFATCFNCWSK